MKKYTPIRGMFCVEKESFGDNVYVKCSDISWKKNCDETPIPEISEDSILLIRWTSAIQCIFTGYAFMMIDDMYKGFGNCGTDYTCNCFLHKQDISHWMEIPIINIEK